MEKTYTAVCINATGLESDLTVGNEYELCDLGAGWVKVTNADEAGTLITSFDRFIEKKKTVEKEIVICNDNQGNESRLTEGKEYEVLGYSELYYRIQNDKGNNEPFRRTRFTKKEKTMDLNTNAKTMIKNRRFVIATVNSLGQFSMSGNPMSHNTAEQAKKEAERLAKLDSSKMFVVMQFQAGFQAAGIVEI